MNSTWKIFIYLDEPLGHLRRVNEIAVDNIQSTFYILKFRYTGCKIYMIRAMSSSKKRLTSSQLPRGTRDTFCVLRSKVREHEHKINGHWNKVDGYLIGSNVRQISPQWWHDAARCHSASVSSTAIHSRQHVDVKGWCSLASLHLAVRCSIDLATGLAYGEIP